MEIKVLGMERQADLPGLSGLEPYPGEALQFK